MSNDVWNLTGKKALITGGTSGMGKAIAELQLRKGAEIFITARNSEQINQLLSKWKKTSYTAYGASSDLIQAGQREKLIKTVKQSWDNLDVLVNNVGPNFKKPFFEYSLEEYQSLIDGNMTSTFHITKLCYPLLMASQHASIINISAISSSVAFKGSGPFGMAKSGIESFTRTLAVELGNAGIRANAISPGFIATEGFLKKYDSVYLERASNQIPLSRMGSSQDIANLACFLAMPASAYISGQCITVDGGFTSYGFGGVNEQPMNDIRGCTYDLNPPTQATVYDQ